MKPASASRIDLACLRRMKADRRKFAMLTAYDYPTAAAAQAAGVHSLLIGDSMGCVVLGHDNTRRVPLDLMITLGEAVRRGAPNVYLIGDMPYECMVAGDEAVLAAARRFRNEAGCDGVKVEVESNQHGLVAALARDDIEVVAHLGLRPQTVTSPAGYRAQARDEDGIKAVVADARRMVDAGAAMLLLEAVPNEASTAVMNAVGVPVIGCGAGPACDGHVVVTHDMLGIRSLRVPRFVPLLANFGEQMQAAMRRWVEAIEQQTYPAPEHVYPMKTQPADARLTP
jgi:3-methyl-2-oxobutanoate hydroxymethyltransferase